MAIQVKKVTFTPAAVYLLNAVPAIALAAPAAGFVNNILGITEKLVFNSFAYAGATQVYFYPAGGVDSPTFIDSNSLVTVSDEYFPVSKSSDLNTVLSTDAALMITTDAVASVGDSDLVYFIIYETILAT